MSVEREARLGLEHARRAGNRRHEKELTWWLVWQLPQGPKPVEEAVREWRRLHDELEGDRAAEAVLLESLAQLEAMRGRLRDARRLAESSMEIRAELGMHVLRTRGLLILATVDLAAGDLAAAEGTLRLARDEAQGGDIETVSNSASLLVDILCRQGLLEEADPISREAEETAIGDAVVPQVRWRCARAKLLAQREELDAAETVARAAVDIARNTDDLNLHGTALLSLAEVLAAGDRPEDAHAAAEVALALYERKGNIVLARTAREFLARLSS
ncbi:MAG: hypothetical protein H0U82_02055 [Actinobacteria bacterium]|nr:hypothetical protein [Actinomycetota bacterium]